MCFGCLAGDLFSVNVGADAKVGGVDQWTPSIETTQVELSISAPLLLGSGLLLGRGLFSAQDGETPGVLAVQLNGFEEGSTISAIKATVTITSIGQSVELSISAPLLLGFLGFRLSRAKGWQTPWVLAFQFNGGDKGRIKTITITTIAQSIAQSVEGLSLTFAIEMLDSSNNRDLDGLAVASNLWVGFFLLSCKVRGHSTLGEDESGLLSLNDWSHTIAETAIPIAESVELCISAPLLLGCLFLSWGGLLLRCTENWGTPDGVLAQFDRGRGDDSGGGKTVSESAVAVTTIGKSQSVDLSISRGSGSQSCDSRDKGLHCV